MPQPDEHWMREALAEAEAAAQRGEVPVGAIIVLNDEIIGAGSNTCEADQQAVHHAEMHAIQQASKALGSWRLEDCTLYVTLEPCPMCLGACLNARIPRVVFGTTEPKAGACGSVVDLRAPSGFNHAIDVIGGVLAEESAALLRAFFRELRNQRKQS